MSKVVSFQYEASTITASKEGVLSPVTSYQLQSPTPGTTAESRNSPQVSYLIPKDTAKLVLAQVDHSITVSEAFSDCGLSAKLRVFPEASVLSGDKLTIVLTHGWIWDALSTDKQGIQGWPFDYQRALLNRDFTSNANIVAWDWEQDATTSAIPPIFKTLVNGELLGKALVERLGNNYKKPIHFIGHSLGAIVNARAADYIHTNGFSPQQTHLTIFDEASIAQLVDTHELAFKVYRPVPKDSYWVDNYSTSVGHTELLFRRYEAVNVVLLRGLGDHFYSYGWYKKTIENPELSTIGFQSTFESGFDKVRNPVLKGTIFWQDWIGAGEFNFGVTEADGGFDWPTLNGIKEASYTIIDRTLIRPVKTVAGTIKSAGENLAKWTAVTIDSALDAALHFRIRRGESARAISDGEHGLRGLSSQTNASALRMPLYIPRDVIALSFQYSFDVTNTADLASLAIDGRNVFSSQLRARLSENGESGPLDLSPWLGKTVEIVFSLIGKNGTTNALTVESFTFYRLKPPSLSIELTDGAAKLLWPITTTVFQLEGADRLDEANQWKAVVHSVNTNSALRLFEASVPTAKGQFFRLRQL